MEWKGKILLLLLIRLLRVFGSPDNCGQHFNRVLMEDFDGAHSYVSYTIDERYMKPHYLSYHDRFCTNNGSGIIAQLTSRKLEEDIIIEITGGQVAVELIKKRVSNPECMSTLNKKVTDGSSYLIDVEIKEKELTITLFGQYIKISSLTVMNTTECLEGNFSGFNFLEKGGHKVDSAFSEGIQAEMEATHLGKPHLYGDFDGCIGDSILNGIPINKAGNQNENHDIYPTCEQNFGPECTKICATSYVVVGEDKCGCPKDSEINELDLCAQSCNCITCQNGGSCISKSGSDSVCECPRDYEGKYCEKEIDRCQGFNCQNGGTCTVRGSVPSCICLPNFTGFQCEVSISPEDPCDKIHCQNNATCKGGICFCLPEYSGKLCESEISRDHRQTDNTMIPEYVYYVVAFLSIILLSVSGWVIWYKFWKLRQQSDDAQNPTTTQGTSSLPQEQNPSSGTVS